MTRKHDVELSQWCQKKTFLLGQNIQRMNIILVDAAFVAFGEVMISAIINDKSLLGSTFQHRSGIC